MSSERVIICPVCNTAELVRHCPSSGCAWHRCRPCKVTFDLAARRGFTKGGKPVTLA